MVNPIQVFKSLEGFGPNFHRIRIVKVGHELVPVRENKPSFFQKIIELFYKPKSLRRAYVEEKVYEYIKTHQNTLQAESIDVLRLQERLKKIDSGGRLGTLFQAAIQQKKQAELERQHLKEQAYEAELERQRLERQAYEQRCDVVIHCKDGVIRATWEELEKCKTLADLNEASEEKVTDIQLETFSRHIVSTYLQRPQGEEFLQWLKYSCSLEDLFEIARLADFLQDDPILYLCDDSLSQRLILVEDIPQLNQYTNIILDHAYQGLKQSRNILARRILNAPHETFSEELLAACRNIPRES